MASYIPTFPNATSASSPSGTWTAMTDICVPSGIIVMWYGLLSAIPTGWLLCDGANGTPDLRSRFVLGTAAGDNPGLTGGASTHTHASHTFTGTLASLTHVGSAVADHASHTHTVTAVGTNSAPALTMNSNTPAGTVSTPTFTGSALATHAHELPFQVASTLLTRQIAAATFGTGTSRAATAVSATGVANTTSAAVALTQAVSAGTPAGTVSTPTFTGTPETLTGTVTSPTFSGSSVTSGSPSATLTHAVTQPTAHSYTPVGTLDAHDTVNHTPPYTALAFIMKT